MVTTVGDMVQYSFNSNLMWLKSPETVALLESGFCKLQKKKSHGCKSYEIQIAEHYNCYNTPDDSHRL